MGKDRKLPYFLREFRRKLRGADVLGAAAGIFVSVIIKTNFGPDVYRGECNDFAGFPLPYGDSDLPARDVLFHQGFVLRSVSTPA